VTGERKRQTVQHRRGVGVKTESQVVCQQLRQEVWQIRRWRREEWERRGGSSVSGLAAHSTAQIKTKPGEADHRARRHGGSTMKHTMKLLATPTKRSSGGTCRPSVA
jgi:hypothetical protein